VELSGLAELQVLLEGVPLPAGRRDLVRYAEHEGATPYQLGALRSLSEQRWETIDAVGEALRRVQPPLASAEPHPPREESGAPPGGPAYTEPHPESGEVRDRDAVSA
jgi:hypothetical protein